ncbi:phosphoglucosamine mutase [Candidatus Formimonas warabiya]|uniref:Phosphoglucosamine mutase n=1 Tax=Formimonas warabiya TaxID=1761012 RepID=A0A3G1KS01_FORW1|nr:phosphoglucosamine mutase [Candidatus Formimonas warabiya]ATW25249.1 phosphoglucosamine mutase [Candidatus Formimonas warabiya]
MGVLFGTDGVRGVANRDLNPDLAFKLGRAGAFCLARDHQRPKILIGKDTRLSGDMLESALAAGICSVGADVVRLGIIPTPGVAYLTRELGAQAGVVISASHNPMEDNGIKFFGSNGYKLPDALEEEIEAMIASGQALPSPVGKDVGKVEDYAQAGERYGAYLKRCLGSDLSGLKIVVDCAQGAAYSLAPSILKDLGAEVMPISNSPTGTNINEGCGSTHPEKLMETVKIRGAHLGIAYDGDADRMLAVDEEGNLVDGDKIMVICALDMLRKGKLKQNQIVVTVMSNMGLYLALKKAGIEILDTKVGDRYVLEKMRESGAVLGGEQSGHIIFSEYNTTGDGIATSLQVLKVMVETGKPLSELAAQMLRLPQVLVNVRVKDKTGLETSTAIKEAISLAEKTLSGRGRVLVRTSGTEPLVRVMAEGPDEGELQNLVQSIVRIVEAELA